MDQQQKRKPCNKSEILEMKSNMFSERSDTRFDIIAGSKANCPDCDKEVYVYPSKANNPYYCQTQNRTNFHKCKKGFRAQKQVLPDYMDIMLEIKNISQGIEQMKIDMLSSEKRIIKEFRLK